jgi:CBS domain-containing protein
MHKPISELMTDTPQCVDTEATVENVEHFMASHKLASVPVKDQDGAIFGILSAPDILAFHAARRNPRTVRAWELCTYKPLRVAPDAPISEVAAMMMANKVHHVLVMQGDALRGVVSSLDFVKLCLTSAPER